MSRFFSCPLTDVALPVSGGAIDIFELTGIDGVQYVLHEVYLSQSPIVTPELLNINIHTSRGTVGGTGGSTGVIVPLDGGPVPSPSTKVELLNTTPGSNSNIFHEEGWIVSRPWHYRPTPDQRFRGVTPFNLMYIAVRCSNIPATPEYRVLGHIVWEEIGQ